MASVEVASFGLDCCLVQYVYICYHFLLCRSHKKTLVFPPPSDVRSRASTVVIVTPYQYWSCYRLLIRALQMKVMEQIVELLHSRQLGVVA